MNRIVFLFMSFCILLVSIGNAADVLKIKWEDLVPELPPEKDVLTGLSEEQRGLVEYIIYLGGVLPDKTAPENKDFYDEMAKTVPALKKKGIDINDIIAQRQYRASVVNTSLDGKNVRISGYMLPLNLVGNTVTDFLLVPYVGACIHVPPPPANQIIHAVSATKKPYKIDEIFKPVTVTGKLKAKSLSKNLFLVDGSSDISIGYTISAEKIEDYKI